jgi:drug/metabolite transporter (DMT)-like permease
LSTFGGFAVAVGAAALYGASPVAQAVAATRSTTGSGLGVGLTLRLARQPIWLLGLACDLGGFAMEAYAFSLAPATLVAPVMAADMLVFLLLATVVLRSPLTRTGWIGAGILSLGAALLALAFTGGGELGAAADNASLLWMLTAALVVCGGVVGMVARFHVRGPVAALGFSLAAGVAFGLATMATRQVGRTFDPHQPLELFTTPTPYLLAVCSLLAITIEQRALQNDPFVAFPVTSAVSAFLPAILGAAVLGDEVPGGFPRVVFVVALALLAAGVAVVGRSRAHSEDST